MTTQSSTPRRPGQPATPATSRARAKAGTGSASNPSQSAPAPAGRPASPSADKPAKATASTPAAAAAAGAMDPLVAALAAMGAGKQQPAAPLNQSSPQPRASGSQPARPAVASPATGAGLAAQSMPSSGPASASTPAALPKAAAKAAEADAGAAMADTTEAAPAGQPAAATPGKRKKKKKTRNTNKAARSHVDLPDQHDDFISPWNKARVKVIQNPNPGLSTRQTHLLELPELCPASHNPLPGSSIGIYYKSKRRFLEVFSLSAYIQASIGHPIVRDVEALTQAIALDCAQALGQKVQVEGRFLLRGLAQKVITKVSAKPIKPRHRKKAARRIAQQEKAARKAARPDKAA